MKQKNKNNFVKIAHYAFRPEAEMASSILKKAGVSCLIQASGDSAYGADISAGGFYLSVIEKDAARARDLIPCQED